jgi:hypothetical protein
MPAYRCQSCDGELKAEPRSCWFIGCAILFFPLGLLLFFLPNVYVCQKCGRVQRF